MLQTKVDAIIAEAKNYLSTPGLETKIQKAFEFAEKAHRGQMRHSGEPYITHPVEVVIRLMSLHPDLPTIQAGFLHDVPEDTKVTVKEIEKEFGPEVASLTEAMTKLGKIKYRGEERSIENLRKLFLAIAKDLRVALIKLCDRLHNMETLHFHPKPEKVNRIASETLNIYVPIAARLGIYTIKDELEDLCFKHLYPDDYARITKELQQKSKVREKFITVAQQQLLEILKKGGIEAMVTGRVKEPYSVFKKMQKKQVGSIDQLYDIFALRVVVKDKAACYSALGLIHEHFTPLPARFKDYIAVPKNNNYQSLHTTVVGLGKKLRDQPTEIQIRTADMHRQAEFGIAAHSLYKEKGSRRSNREELNWIRHLEHLSTVHKDQTEFISSVTGDVFQDRIFVLTPKGEVKDLPMGSTPVDFAYAIHTDIGHRCKGAKIEGEIVPLNHELQSGDVVEILTRKDPQPNQYWLSFVKTAGARSKIKAWFHEQNKEQLIRLGKDMLNKQLERLGYPLLDPELAMLKNWEGRDTSLPQREALLESIGNGSVNLVTMIRKLFPAGEPAEKKMVPATGTDAAVKLDRVIIADEKNIHYKLAACCQPKPGDKLIAYITRGRNVSVHRSDCKMLQGLQPQRFLAARWETQRGTKVYTRAFLHVQDRVGVLKEILNIMYRQGVNVLDINIDRHPNDQEAHIIFDLDITDYEILDRLIGTLSVLDFMISADGKLIREEE